MYAGWAEKAHAKRAAGQPAGPQSYVARSRTCYPARVRVVPPVLPYTPHELAQIAAIADGLPVGIFVSRAPDGSFVYANRAFEEIFGMPPLSETQAGAYARSYRIHTRDGASYPEDRLPFARVLLEKVNITIDDIVIHRADGRKVFVRAFARPLLDRTGAIEHVTIAFTDITEEVEARSHAESVERHLEHVFAHAPLILFAFDRHGIVTLSEGRGLESIGGQLQRGFDRP